MDLVKTHNLLPEGVSTTDARSIEFATEVINCLPYEPNDEQMELLAAFAHFMLYGHPQAAPHGSLFHSPQKNQFSGKPMDTETKSHTH